MTFQQSLAILMILGFFISGFAVGLWYADTGRATQTALDRGRELGRLEERAVQQEAAQALLEAVRVSNPFTEGLTGNPFRDSYQNPYGEAPQNIFE